MRRFFSTDPHFGHKRIIPLAGRPFRDVTHMNEMIVANWNSVVSPEDSGFILGDIAVSYTHLTLPTNREV